MKRLSLCALAALLLVGCASTPTDNTAGRAIAFDAVKLVVRQGVARYIQSKGPGAQVERALRVKTLAEGVLAVASGDRAATLDTLKAAALAYIPASFTPADRMAAEDIIDEVVALIRQKVGEGELSGNAIVTVREVLGWISEATDYFASS